MNTAEFNNVIYAGIRSRGPLRFVTDFSGMDMAAFALRAMRIPGGIEQIAYTDIDDTATRFARANHTVAAWHRDVQVRTSFCSDIDLYVAGPPCQPCPPAGKIATNN